MRSHLTTSLLVIVLALSLTAATCHHGTPRHDTTVNLGILVTALKGIQDGEQGLYGTGVLAGLTPSVHRSFNAEMSKIWSIMGDAVQAAKLWTPGQPIPTIIITLLGEVRVLANDAATLLGAELPDKVNAVWSALATLLSEFTGVMTITDEAGLTPALEGAR